MRKNVLLLYLFLFNGFYLIVGNQAYAQLVVKGIVKDENGAGLPGVSVTVKDTKNGTSTNEKGEFTLSVSAGSTLLLSAIGYEPQSIPVATKSLYTVTLKSAQNDLDQIVVVGYGSTKKKDISGAVATVSGEDISGRQVMQISDALQGAVAGVTVTRNGGSPGGSSTIRFRGITTIGANYPLIIIDGVPADNIDNINPDDVESITALKDNASASIYGSRAAAGVILITTKRAKSGQSNISYSFEHGNIKPTSLPTYVDAVRYMQLYNEFLANDGTAALYSPAFINTYNDNHAANPDLFPNTDWQGGILKGSASQEMHHLAFTAGSEKIRTRASLGYTDIGGLYANRSYNKYTLEVNNDFKFNKLLSATFDIVGYRAQNNNPAGGSPIYASRMLPPIYDDFFSDGRLAPGKDGLNPHGRLNEGGFEQATNNKIGTRISLNANPIDGLTITGLFAPNYNFVNGKTFTKTVNYTDINDPTKILIRTPANTSLSESRPYSYNLNAQLLVKYLKTIQLNHNLDVLLGYENNYSYSESLSASRGSFTLSDYPYLDNGLLALRDNGGGASENALRSYFGRVSYNYKNKYYLQANGRFDGSSRFSSVKRWSFFPAFSTAWVISEENFFKNIKGVNFFKLRGSWGQSGNERIGDYPYQASITFNNALFYNNNQVVANTSGSQISYAVDNLTWETQQTVNLGLDMAFLNNRLTLTGDIFHKQTHDILLQLDIPTYMGYANPYQNAGKVSAKGWELAVNWNDKIRDWSYAFGLNVSDAKTKIVDLKGTQQLGDQANIEGGEFMAWYGYRTNGLYQTPAELVGAPLINANVKAGDLKYIDIDGDNKISADRDRVLLGGSLPRYSYGMNGNVNYKNFGLSFVAQGVLQKLTRLNSIAVQPFLENFGNVPTIIDGHFWSANSTPEQNALATYPRLSRVSAASNNAMSDYWLVDGKYLRIKNITFSYELKSQFIKKLSMQSLRLYVACNDAFTFSKFPKGSDPEVDAVSYPIVRTFIAGLNVRF